jgi:hypothetical protein
MGYTYHQNDILWGKDITGMVASAVAATEWDQREERKADTKGVGLVALMPADAMQIG